MRRALRDMADRVAIAWELLRYLWKRRLWWMIPLVTVLLVLSSLIAFGSTSGVGPFIYTLF